MQETTVIAIRHGETNWNASGRVQGFLDVDLNERGLRQARRLAWGMARESLDAIYSSDLRRTLSTASPLARRLKLPIRTEPRLREWNMGVFESLTIAETLTHSREGHEAYRARTPDFVMPGGESLRQFVRRCRTGVEDLVRAHAGGRIVLFTHGGVIQNMLRRVKNMASTDLTVFSIPNTGRFDFTFAIEDGDVVWKAYRTTTPLRERIMEEVRQ